MLILWNKQILLLEYEYHVLEYEYHVGQKNIITIQLNLCKILQNKGNDKLRNVHLFLALFLIPPPPPPHSEYVYIQLQCWAEVSDKFPTVREPFPTCLRNCQPVDSK